MKRKIALLLAVALALPTISAPAYATDGDGRLTPGDLNFRKVWTHRNMFNTQLTLDELDFDTAAGTEGISVQDGQLVLQNEMEEETSGRLLIGDHTPYGAYDIEVTEQARGTDVSLELVKDENNKVIITQTNTAVNTEKLEFGEIAESLVSELDMSDADLLSKTGVYDDNAPYLSVTKTESGIKFAGDTGRGESFVPVGAARQGYAYEATVSSQTTGYANLIVKLRKDAKNGIFFVQKADSGECSYEIFKDGSSKVREIFLASSTEHPVSPYTMRIEIQGRNLVFSRISGENIDMSKSVDVSDVFDFSDPDVIKDFEFVIGGRIDPNQSVEFSSAQVFDARTELDMSNPDLLGITGVYDDVGVPLAVDKTEGGIKFTGGSAVGESFVPVSGAKQGAIYEATVSGQTTGYANLIVKLRKDAKNGIFFVQRSNNGSVSYEIFKDGTSMASGTFSPAKKLTIGEPYVMRLEIQDKNIVFSRDSAGETDFSQSVDVSGVFDLSDPDVIKDFEFVIGGRIQPNQSVEYSAARVYGEKTDGQVDLDLSDVSKLTRYDDMISKNDKTVLMSNNADGELVMQWDETSTSACESFVAVGKARQGLVHEVTISGQDNGGVSNNAYVLAELRQDANNRILFVSRINGNCNYEMYKTGFNGAQNGGSLSLPTASYPYKLRMEVRGKNVILSRVSMDGTVEGSVTYDVSSKFDLTNTAVMNSLEFAVGARFVNNGAIRFSDAKIWYQEPVDDPDVHSGELKMEAYSGGELVSSRVLASGEFSLPYTIRADFAAKSAVSGINAGTGTGYLNVWLVQDGKATLTNGGGYDIDLKIDFSNPDVLSGYKAYLGYNAQPGSSAKIGGANHYLTGGAAQADPKPLHNQKGEILREGSKIWIAMTTRGYSINSSYQGIYSLDLATNELELVGTMAFNLCQGGVRRYGPYHASDIIYDETSGNWIVMTTSHINNHQVCSGLIPEDPRTAGFQFVDVQKVNYPGSVGNEEDASLIFDEEVGKWRLVMCHARDGGYQLPLFEADSWDGEYTEIARYAEIPCTGIQLQKLDGQYYVFFGRNTDNCEALYSPEMTKAATLKIQSSPRSYNVWPVIIPLEDEDTGVMRYYMLSFDRDTHGGPHSYGNIYLYEAEEAVGLPAVEPDAEVEELEPIMDGKITSAQQVMQIRNDLSGNYTLEADIDLSEVENWVPIGTKEAPFTGSFNGNGHVIANLTSERPDALDVGLFGVIGAGASVSNLTVRGAEVSGRIYTGILAGRNEGVVTDCTVSGDVTTYAAGGALIGQNTGKISDSHAIGTVASVGGDSVGGLVGVNSGNVGTIDLNNKGIIDGCSAQVVVTGFTNVGGLVGQNDCATVSNSMASGTVEGVSYVGGFAGHIGRNYGNNSTSPMNQCFATGDVTGRVDIGGFAGHNDGALTQCFATGAVSGETSVGGFVGRNNNKANVKSSFATGSVDGGEMAGSLFGRNFGSFSGSAGAQGIVSIGNSVHSVVEVSLPDLSSAATYRAGGALSGYDSSVWSLEDGQYPELESSTIANELAVVEAYNALQAVYDQNKDRLEKDYTADTWAPFAEKLQAAKDALDKLSNTAAELEQAKADLEEAASGLIAADPDVPDVDKSFLEALITAIDGKYEQNRFTKESYDALIDALNAAQSVVDSESATQQEVYEAYLALVKARDGLTFAVDKSLLQLAVDLAQQTIDEFSSELTGSSVEALEAVIKAANKLLEDDSATQEQVNAMYTDVMTTITSVVDRANRDYLTALIRAVEALGDDYKPSTLALLEEALLKAQEVEADTDATDEDIQDAYDQLADAVNGLQKLANKDLLEASLNLANDIISSGKYDEETLAALNALLESANSLMDDPEAEQEAVDQMAKDLTIGVSKVRLAKEIKAVKAEMEMIDLTEYTEESVNTLLDAIEEAEAAIESEDYTEADETILQSKLWAGLNGLVLNADDPDEKPDVKPQPTPSKPSKGSVAKVDNSEYWAGVKEKIESIVEGGSVNAELEDGAMLPANVIDALKGKNINLVIAVKGKDVTLNGTGLQGYSAAAVYYTADEIIAMAASAQTEPTTGGKISAAVNPETGGEAPAEAAPVAPEAAVPAEPVLPEAPAVIEPVVPAAPEAPSAQVEPEPVAQSNMLFVWIVAAIGVAAITGAVSLAIIKKKQDSKK
ncbi:GLUG motif-containing protein [Ligaoa zhengdingensis]|uniref:GLUG motif-containing protein n=4 Tax=Ligaoa zhengdingensis TaxID=2763658 RepID=UPI0031BBB285